MGLFLKRSWKMYSENVVEIDEREVCCGAELRSLSIFGCKERETKETYIDMADRMTFRTVAGGQSCVRPARE
jgi:hypothetical protein